MEVTLQGRTLRLKWLTDEEFTEVERIASATNIPSNQCPTCKSRPTVIDDSPGIVEHVNGTYKYFGDMYPCDCQAQMALRARYLLANIGDQYQTLDFDRDWTGCPDAKAMVVRYLTYWQNFRDHGMGLEFGGKNQGTGKTFAATYIGRELIKQRQNVYFLPFIEMVAAFERDASNVASRMKSSTYLILDDVVPPISARQHEFYANQLEALIRHRTDFNLPTIITTNMLEDELTKWYPRTYSLLSAKQMRVDVQGEDIRRSLNMENIELAINGEVRPIT